MDDPPGHARLAALLPDVPRYVETRWMLLESRCEVLGLEEGPDLLSFVARGGEDALIGVVGRPEAGAIAEAAARSGDDVELLAMPENASRVAEALPGWSTEPVVAHLLRDDGERLAGTQPGDIRLLSDPEDLRGLPRELREEFSDALLRGAPFVAAFVGEWPVSFCYAASETEGLWDVSIDTLKEYRRQGYAAACVTHLIRLMRESHRKEPVWHALESNSASIGLAAALGFAPVDRYFRFVLNTRDG